ncbi:MAG: hypothetical protein RIS64_4096 [Bacteroidota bacterium]|jgi:Domain of unknown function (DUF4293)
MDYGLRNRMILAHFAIRNLPSEIVANILTIFGRFNLYIIIILKKTTMIQRIQSVFLLLSSIFNFSLFLQPVYFASRVTEMDAGATSNPIWADGKFNIFDSKVLMIFSILAGISALGAIFLYNNRRLQQKIAYLSAVDGLVTAAMAGLLLSQYREGNLSGWAWVADLLGVVSALLAARYIGKDEKLVRSADRLR